MQVTADGRPVIWHDDLVLSLPSGTAGPPRMHRISELTLRDFKKLSQHSCSSRLEASESSASTRPEVATGAQIGSCAGEAGSQSAQLTEPAASQAGPHRSMQHEQCSAAAEAAVSSGNSKVGARLLRNFNSDQGKRMHAAQAWSVSEEDTLPTLAEVFEVLLCPPTSPDGTLPCAREHALFRQWMSSGQPQCHTLLSCSLLERSAQQLCFLMVSVQSDQSPNVGCRV